MEFLVALATGVVTKLGESLVAPITNQFAYIIRYKRNVKNLESQMKELEGKKLGVQATVDADKRNSHQIASNVEDWLCKIDTIENELQGFYEDDEQVKNKYLNLVSCYSLSKRAKKLTNDIMRLKEEKFEIISYPKPPPRLGSRFLNGTTIKSFQTRESIMCEVIDKLKAEDVNRISICGMGGVGKTTFVKEVIKILEADKSFDEVVMAVVSQTPDCRKIQGQIADAIGLKLDKETDQGRALQLHDRLKNIDSVLIVLDDVWTDLDFESIGIPSTSCKILFTSRIQDVCIKMKSQRNFTVSVLSRDESWDLFNETIGANLAEKPDIHDIAKEIANQCRGLPIAIVTIAKALANKEKHAWEDALEQLRNSSVESFPEMQTSVFSCIELSYNFLGGEEKFFLFLCSLLPEDFDIPIEVLFRHGVGLGMFKGIDALWKVRNRVHTIVDRLKECFMLLDSNVEECVKMHDVVRDTIASVAGKYHHHLECYSSAISLIFEKKTELPHVSNCQKLKLLQVSSKGKESVPENFFQGMNKLMVLSLQNVLIQSMPSTLSALDNIHTLRLEACNVGDISIIGQKLMKLEILSFAKSSIKVLPLEIGQLTLLRLLDLTECNHLIQISATVLASLSRLEELYLRVRNFPSKESNHILFELQCLSHQLKVLEFAFIMVDEFLPKDLIFKNIVRFWVYVGDSSTISHGLVPRGYLHPNVLTLNNTYYSYIKKSVIIQHFLQRVEILSLDDIKNLKCVISDLDEEGFPLLKNLIIESCNNLEYAADSCDDHCVFPQVQSISLRNLENLKAIICHVAHHLSQKVDFSACQCFGSLQVLKIEYCKSLKTIFTLLFPRRTTSLAKLQCLHVVESHGIECIVSINTIKVDDSIIVFTNLVELKLQELPNLTAFIKTSIMHEHHSPYKVQESNTLLENFIEHDQEFSGSASESDSSEHMNIGCALFESNSLQLFPKLEKILLRACSSLNIVFDMKPSQSEDQHVDNAAFFAQLKELELSWLNNLNHIWGSVPRNIQGFHKLKSIKVANCDSLKYIFTPSIVRALTQLEKLVIQSCMSLEKFVGNEQGQNVETLVFVQLESLTLKDLPQLVNFGPNSYMILWPAMKSLCIDGCPLLKASNVCVQENFNVMSNSTTTHDVGTTTSMEDSPSLRFLQCCFGGTKELLVSNSKAKDLKMEEGVVDAKEINFFNEMGGSPMPILEHVIIKGWDSLDVLFHLKQSEDSNNTIVVNCLVKLMTMQLPSSPLGVIAFNNITLLSLEACHRLRYICSYSIAKLLVKLQEIKVSNCKVVEQLFQSEEHEICVDYLEWPSLKRISIINCSMLEVVISKVEEGKINSFIITSFAQLQSLTLTHLPNVISFCNNTFLENGHGNEYFKQDHERASSSEEERNTRLDAPLINGSNFQT
ncbi:probable disease resistance protein At4g27220 [Arachis hypogaea]|uniref:probable disease resistance protein At4g27220 n=1 Tax=Arachis hypogaea TaxID=3818 RepID=UPI003B216A9F